MKKTLLSFAIAGTLLSAAGLAQAHEAGDFILRAGAASVQPDAKPHGTLDTLGTDVDNATALGITAAYMITDSVAVELLAATPFKHDITSTALGGKIAETKQLPPTLSLQYQPQLGLGGFQPYVGVGVNYTAFFDEKTTGALKGHDLQLDNSWGLAWQVGADYQVNPNWLVNASIWNISIDTKAKLDGASVGKMTVDPWVYMVSLGYKF